MLPEHRKREQQGNEVHDAEDAKTFLSSVWFQEREQQEDTDWIQNCRDDIKVANKQEHLIITVEKIRKKVQKMSNYKALGPKLWKAVKEEKERVQEEKEK